MSFIPMALSLLASPLIPVSCSGSVEGSGVGDGFGVGVGVGVGDGLGVGVGVGVGIGVGDVLGVGVGVGVGDGLGVGVGDGVGIGVEWLDFFMVRVSGIAVSFCPLLSVTLAKRAISPGFFRSKATSIASDVSTWIFSPNSVVPSL